MKIQEFQQFTPATQVQPVRDSIVIPGFFLGSAEWLDASQLLLEFPINNTNFFSIKLPIKKFGVNFIVAIRWEVDDEAFRFVFWADEKAKLFFPVYSGEKIGPNAVVEIWSVNDSAAPELFSAITLLTSELIAPNYCNTCCKLPEATPVTLEDQTPTDFNT